jgi:trk system potassium uptake protein TrkH
MLYLALFIGDEVAISAMDGLPMDLCLFETASAVGTVGLTLGVTPSLGAVSRCIIMLLMFLGRVGGLTLIYAAISERRTDLSRLPQEKITVG